MHVEVTRYDSMYTDAEEAVSYPVLLMPDPLTLGNHLVPCMVDLTKISFRHVKCLDVATG